MIVAVFKTPQFTFHSGKIKTIASQGTFLVGEAFTFHSGKIKTNTLDVKASYLLNLHSTLVRLKHGWFVSYVPNVRYLHSTLVRLKRGVALLGSMLILNLHSTLVRLKQRHDIVSFVDSLYLHSTLVRLKLSGLTEDS